jgi:hypothetical protein
MARYVIAMLLNSRSLSILCLRLNSSLNIPIPRYLLTGAFCWSAAITLAGYATPLFLTLIRRCPGAGDDQFLDHGCYSNPEHHAAAGSISNVENLLRSGVLNGTTLAALSPTISICPLV